VSLQYTQASGITAGVTYEFRIIAVNGVGNSSASTSIAIKAAQIPDAPSTPVKSAAD